MAKQPRSHLAVGCRIGQFAFAERIAVLTVAVEYLVFGDFQRQLGQFKHLVTEGWRGIGHDLSATFSAAGCRFASNHLIGGLQQT